MASACQDFYGEKSNFDLLLILEERIRDGETD